MGVNSLFLVFADNNVKGSLVGLGSFNEEIFRQGFNFFSAPQKLEQRRKTPTAKMILNSKKCFSWSLSTK